MPSAADSTYAVHRVRKKALQCLQVRIVFTTKRYAFAEAGVTPNVACTHIHRSLEQIQTQTNLSVPTRMCAVQCLYSQYDVRNSLAKASILWSHTWYAVSASHTGLRWLSICTPWKIVETLAWECRSLLL